MYRSADRDMQRRNPGGDLVERLQFGGGLGRAPRPGGDAGRERRNGEKASQAHQGPHALLNSGQRA